MNGSDHIDRFTGHLIEDVIEAGLRRHMYFIAIYHRTSDGFGIYPIDPFEGTRSKIETTQYVGSTVFIDRVNRINRYFDALIKSFEIMINGMDREEFLKFRMSLLPASGFQSAQYREIEIFSTDFINLVAKDEREALRNQTDIAQLFEHIY